MVSQTENPKPPNSLNGVLRRIKGVLGQSREQLTGEVKRRERIQDFISLFEDKPELARQIFSDSHSLFKEIHEKEELITKEATGEELLKIYKTTDIFQGSTPEQQRLKELPISTQLSEKTERAIREIQTFARDFQVPMTVAQTPQLDLERVVKEAKQNFQDVAVAYFLATNRVSRKSEGKRFDEAMEGRQLKAILAMLEGNHIHVGTGEGKSSVILPIATIVEALTSDKQSAVLATSDQVLLADLKKQTKRYLERMPEATQPISEVDFQQAESVPLSQELKDQMIKEAMVSGKYSEKTKIAIKDQYWASALMTNASGDEFHSKDNKPRIIYTTESDLVFKSGDYLDKPEKFREIMPTIFLDEADAPYNRRSGYHTVTPVVFFTPDEVIGSMTDWAIYYAVNKSLSPEDFKLAEKSPGYELTEEAENRLRENFKVDSIALDQAVGIMSKKYLDSKNKRRLKKQISAEFEKRTHEYEGDFSEYYVQVGYDLAGIYKEKGRSHIEGEAKSIPRDSYVDQLLEKYTFDYARETAMSVQKGKFEFLPARRRAQQSLFFQSFVVTARANLRCASGTLLYPDPVSGNISKSPFGSFLEWATQKEIVKVSPPQVKKAPTPLIYWKNPPFTLPQDKFDEEKDKLLVDRSVEGVILDIKKNNRQPILVVSHDIGESQQIYEKLRLQLGEQAVGYVGSKTEDLEYQQKAEKLFSQLAEYNPNNQDSQLRVIVSSGSVGIGANIMKADGHAPDLRVIVHGIPQSRAQLMQVLGRRRAEGDSFGWYLNEEHLERFFSLYKRELALLDTGKDDKAVRKELVSAQGDHEKQLKLVLELMRTMEASQAQDDSMVVNFGSVIGQIQRRALTQIEERLWQAATQKYNITMDEVKKNIEINKRINMGGVASEEEKKHLMKVEPAAVEVRVRLAQIGLPAELYREVLESTGWASKQGIGMATSLTGQGETTARNVLKYLGGSSLWEAEPIDESLRDNLQGWYEEGRDQAEQLSRILYQKGLARPSLVSLVETFPVGDNIKFIDKGLIRFGNKQLKYCEAKIGQDMTPFLFDGTRLYAIMVHDKDRLGLIDNIDELKIAIAELGVIPGVTDRFLLYYRRI